MGGASFLLLPEFCHRDEVEGATCNPVCAMAEQKDETNEAGEDRGDEQ